MKSTIQFFIVLACCLIINIVWAEDIEVGLEPLPPLIVNKTTGLSIKLLKEAEKISDLRFKITMMPYNRAKNDLKGGSISMMGHTPKGQEEKEFYTYAHELDWSVPTVIDLYTITKGHLAKDMYKKIPKIGTPRGNKEFLAELLGIPLKHFYEGELNSLLKMMKGGRVDAILFERASTQSTIKELKLSGIMYKKLVDVAAGFGLQKTPEGTRLKIKIDKILSKVNKDKIFKDYLNYMSLPPQGKVSIK